MRRRRQKTYNGDSNDHVVDLRSEGVDGTLMLVLGVPHLKSNIETWLCLVDVLHHSDINWHVTEVLDGGTSWSSNSDLSSFNYNLDCRKKNKMMS